jgi:polysaccharide export outer membrane protein
VGISPRPPVATEAYRISSGDLLSITVWGEDRFTQECQVNGSGTISYPLLGDVPAARATCSELQAHLQENLQKYLKRPRVIVTVRQYGGLGTSVFVLGEVKTPGVYPLASGSGLTQALAAAGGPTRLASGEITIVKARTGETRTAGLEQAEVGAPVAPEAVLEPGDVIMVNGKPDAEQDRRYAVLGEVPTPGMFDMPVDREVRVLDALQKAGLSGANQGASPGAHGAAAEEPRTADLEHAFLTRAEVVVPLNLAALLQGDTSQNLVLEPGDVLTVPRRALIRVYALGQVQAPGRQMLPPNSTVLDLLNAVGGGSSTAKLSDAIILRAMNGKPTAIPVNLGRLMRNADPKQNLTLQEGDVLCVPAKGEPGQGIWRWLPFLPYLVGLRGIL